LYLSSILIVGVIAGLSQFVQQWINALQFWWGGWLLYNYPNKYGFNDFLVSNFALLFSLFGLGAAFQDMSDRKETEKSASRIFYLLDRLSQIDPMSEDGKILDTGTDQATKKKRKSSIKRKKSSKIMEPMEEEPSQMKESDESKAGKAKKKKSARKIESDVTDASAKSEKKKKKSSKKLNDGEVNAEEESPKKRKSSVKKKKSKSDSDAVGDE
jgi:hypothetical protein